jgi:1-phosphofructokinase
MIYTLTLNPALDITITTDSISKDSINKTELRSVSAGGKGFNTSRALNCLKTDNKAIAFCGGLFGDDMIKMLEKEKIRTRLIPIRDNIRVNIKVVEKESKKLIEFNEKGPLVQQDEMDFLISILKRIRPRPEYIIISGSLPDKTDAGIYKKIIEILKADKIKTLLDASGEALYHGMLSLPDIVKVNKYEISEVCEKYFKIEQEKLIADLLDKGIRMIMVTNGPEDIIYFDRTGTYSITPPDVAGPYMTGAGDSVNAGLIYALKNNFSTEKRLKFAIACGNANILSEIPGKFEIEMVNSLLPDIKVQKIDSRTGS